MLIFACALFTLDSWQALLRIIESSIRAMSQESPELLALLADCPPGAETLVARIVLLLTEKGEERERDRDCALQTADIFGHQESCC